MRDWAVAVVPVVNIFDLVSNGRLREVIYYLGHSWVLLQVSNGLIPGSWIWWQHIIKSEWIGVRDGTSTSICIRIDAAVQPDRIRLDVSSNSGVIIPVRVVVQPRLGVVVLAGEAQVVDK